MNTGHRKTPDRQTEHVELFLVSHDGSATVRIMGNSPIGCQLSRSALRTQERREVFLAFLPHRRGPSSRSFGQIRHRGRARGITFGIVDRGQGPVRSRIDRTDRERRNREDIGHGTSRERSVSPGDNRIRDVGGILVVVGVDDARSHVAGPRSAPVSETAIPQSPVVSVTPTVPESVPPTAVVPARVIGVIMSEAMVRARVMTSMCVARVVVSGSRVMGCVGMPTVRSPVTTMSASLREARRPTHQHECEDHG
jgi:hypothetical protein